LGNFLKRLEVYTTIPPNPILTEVIVKIMVELLSVLALASKQIKQGRFSECTVTYIYIYIYIVRDSIHLREIHKKAARGERD
jgi:hypothetical protein